MVSRRACLLRTKANCRLWSSGPESRFAHEVSLCAGKVGAPNTGGACKLGQQKAAVKTLKLAICLFWNFDSKFSFKSTISIKSTFNF
jgi:hypothetical protein